MPKVPCLSRGKDRNWGLRRRVPDALRKIIGKGEIWISYGPVSHAAARDRHDAEREKVTRAFAEARRRLKAGNTAPSTIDELAAAAAAPVAPVSALVEPTLTDVQDAIRYWFHRQEERRMAVPVPADRKTHAAGLDNFPEDLAELSGEEGRRIAERQLPAIMGAYGFAAPAARDMQRIAVQMVQRAIVEGEHRDWDRWRGITEGDHDPAFAAITMLSPALPKPKAGLTFGALIDRYLAAPERSGLSPKTKVKYAGFRRVLVEIIGETKAASALDRAACRDAQAVLLALPANAIKRWPKLTAREASEKARAEGVPGMHP